MRKITVTEGLNELKLYDVKINKGISVAQFCGAAKKSSDKVGVVQKEDFIKRATASFQSVEDMISNRNKLKSAIVKSNAETIINVNGKEMTRAEGIERKNSIEYEESLLMEMKKQYVSASATVEKENKKVDAKIDDLISTLVGRDSSKKIDKEEQEAVEKPYREKNEFMLVDPIGIFDKMLELEAEIEGFKSNIDSALVLSNATSFIEVDF